MFYLNHVIKDKMGLSLLKVDYSIKAYCNVQCEYRFRKSELMLQYNDYT